MKKGSHTQYDIEYYIVWITKYRYKILKRSCTYIGNVTENMIKEYIENQDDSWDEIFKIIKLVEVMTFSHKTTPVL